MGLARIVLIVVFSATAGAALAAAQVEQASLPCNSICRMWLDMGQPDAAPEAAESPGPTPVSPSERHLGPAPRATARINHVATTRVHKERPSSQATRSRNRAIARGLQIARPRIAGMQASTGSSPRRAIIPVAVESREFPSVPPVQALRPAAKTLGPAATTSPVADVPVAPLE